VARYDRTDLTLTSAGDLALTAGGDLATVNQLQYQAQQALCRVKSVTVDWLYDNVGADLEDLLGLENNPATAELFKTKVKAALTQGGFLEEQDIYAEVIPTDKAKLVMFLFLNSPFAQDATGFEVSLDLAAGAIIRPI
jgi:hypothetical protein